LKERGGNVLAYTVPNLKAETLTTLLKDLVRLDAEMLVTDELRSYRKAAQEFRHEAVKHSQTFVNGNVHTMGVENFWSLFKRGMIGVYHRVSAKYLQAYLNEFVFRFNNRYNENIFETVLANC
jgi:transposase-like protein